MNVFPVFSLNPRIIGVCVSVLFVLKKNPKIFCKFYIPGFKSCLRLFSRIFHEISLFGRSSLIVYLMVTWPFYFLKRIEFFFEIFWRMRFHLLRCSLIFFRRIFWRFCIVIFKRSTFIFFKIPDRPLNSSPEFLFFLFRDTICIMIIFLKMLGSIFMQLRSARDSRIRPFELFWTSSLQILGSKSRY